MSQVFSHIETEDALTEIVSFVEREGENTEVGKGVRRLATARLRQLQSDEETSAMERLREVARAAGDARDELNRVLSRLQPNDFG